MRLIILIALLASFIWANPIEAFAQKMQYEQDYEVAVAKAKKVGKPLFMLMVTPECKWCKRFEETVLIKPEIDKMIQKEFVALIIDRDEFKYPEKYYIPGVPGLFFMNFKTGKEDSVVGFQKESAFLFMMDNFLN